MPDEIPVLTNNAAATRLRELLHQLVEDEPPLGPLLVHTLMPTPEEQRLLSDAPPEEKR
ncbi:hypothetical protein [Actinophytocola algeriensis]|uniref:Uncharacterized protein n=1 Tax=Actinophytocola algeriensis TaxID=1768010 RepID=A0A7W7Q6Y3_9PSEU|nr:hypothetical protein [Actinophytocola algeriensis]MBB4908211.1 hypothetical protein [Actinophytocola algeriensis]MBE1480241.1 hypothetical protein [Actinophytocola algeriensis]